MYPNVHSTLFIIYNRQDTETTQGRGEHPRWWSRKTLSLPPLMSTPKSQLSAEKTSMKKKMEPTRKDLLQLKT